MITDDDMEKMEGVAATKGKDGDLHAIELSRRLWHDRGRRVSIALPPVDDMDGVKRAHAEVIAAMAAGTLTTREAMDLSAMLEHRRRILVAIDFEREMREIEDAEDAPAPPRDDA